MSDPLTTSRTARESLARALNALQADPTVPPHLVDLAAPIAQAMGALHQLEKTNQLAPHADVALNHVRGALAKLQTAGGAHAAVEQAVGAVAQSLSLVHALSRMANGPSPGGTNKPPPQQPPQQQPPPPQQPPQPQAAPLAQTAIHQGGPAQQQHHHAPQQPMRDPFASPVAATQLAPGNTTGAMGAKPASPSMPVPAPPTAGNMQLVSADLGAHSPTNFYKGLSGNDIIDHGGLFVSTYVSPKIGTPIRLKVSLPGGYEFEANAVVRWTREQGDDASPGFGAAFTAITNEARQLIYRYVRNREPLFYDEL